MLRTIEPELLDVLPPVDPAAVRSRSDLRRLNRIMGHATMLKRALLKILPKPSPARIVELGAGDGSFLLRVARGMPSSWRGTKLILIDQRDIISSQTREGFKALGWSAETVAADVFEWVRTGAIEKDDILVANLFLHHFPGTALRELFKHTGEKARALIAIEPRRALLPLVFTHLLWFIGCNRVTRHDASVSVRAGFNELELTRLWFAESSWLLTEGKAGLFSHKFVATRVPLPP